MLTHMGKYLFLMVLITSFFGAVALADQNQVNQQQPNAQQQPKRIYKVKPAAPAPVWKVKPSLGLQGLSRYNPFAWGAECYLPTPAPRQFEAGVRVWFPRIQGQISKGGTVFLGGERSVVDFDDHLGLSKSGTPVWSIMAHYQVAPRWGIHYSFSPLMLEATNTANTSFTFMGNTVTAGSIVHSKWERYENRAGLVFDVTRSANSVASVYADWLYIQDKISMRQTLGGINMVWNDDKSLAVVGLQLNKCLKNFRGNTLALTCKAGVAFLGDHNGYELETGLSYLVPIRQGRFGYLKGGYRFAQLDKDTSSELFKTRMDGAFVEAGFIF